MKTSLYNKLNRFGRGWLMLLLSVVCSLPTKAGDKIPNVMTTGVGVGSFVSGSGHGTFYSGYVFLDYKKVT